MTLTRRHFLAASGAVSLTAILAGCAGFSKPQTESATGTLTFTTWGTDAELAGFRRRSPASRRRTRARRSTLNAVPYEQMFTNIDAQLQAGNPPDVFRVPYYTFGSYAGRGPAARPGAAPRRRLRGPLHRRGLGRGAERGQAVRRPAPHRHLGDPLQQDRCSTPPASPPCRPRSTRPGPGTQFDRGRRRRCAESLPADKYPFAYNWQGNGVTRWLSLLFQADGRFLAEDLTSRRRSTPTPGARRSTSPRSFFADELVPPNDSVKSTTYAADTWYSQTAAMVFGGRVPDPGRRPDARLRVGRDLRPAQRARRRATSAATRWSPRPTTDDSPTLAATFLDFVTAGGADARLLRGRLAAADPRGPRRRAASSFAVRPELSPVFLGQASTVQRERLGPGRLAVMSKIITVLKDQLEQAFVGGQSTDDDARRR